MRWSGQQVLDDGVGAAPALPGLRGLLRTVRVPEFAGVTFHEVEAKSVLNRVPGGSPVPFRWTVNPYRGCAHACVYCVDGATRVLSPDGRARPIADLRPGDAVLGTAVDGAGVRRYVPTQVLAHWSTTKPAHRVTLADGTTLVASGEHRFLTTRGWRHVAPGWCRAGRRRRLRRGDVLLGPGAVPVAREHTVSYRQGYLHGLVRADAAGSMPVRDGRIDHVFPSDRLELEALGRAHHLLATEAAERTRSHAPAGSRRPAVRVGHAGGTPVPAAPVPAAAGPAVAGSAAAGSAAAGPTAAGPTAALPVQSVPGFVPAPGPGPGLLPAHVAAPRPADPDDDWCAGFLGGVADAVGATTAGELVFGGRAAVGGAVGGAVDGGPGGAADDLPGGAAAGTGGGAVDGLPGGAGGGSGGASARGAGAGLTDELLGLVTGALHRLGFSFVVERAPAVVPAGGRRPGRPVQQVRLGGGSRELLRFVAVADPAVGRVRGLAGATASADGGLEVIDVSPAGAPVPMFDVTTGTGDFVAEGTISHNCFARQTHTYLDLDAGADFDRQIVVKVNVARVLQRELRAPRWAREPVAMGTNTDPYQRAEGRYRLMPGVIDALARSGTPFSVLTKGTVLGRDLPRLRAASADVPVGLGVSIALLDRELQARLEPGTPSPEARLRLVRRIADAGLPCGVMVAPVLPMLTDSVEALDALLARIAAAGATGATVLALHLRPGAREWFSAWLAREHPALVEPYARLYRRGSYVDPAYRRALAERVAPLLRRHGLASEVAPLHPAGDADRARPASGPASDSGAGTPTGTPTGSVGLHRALAAAGAGARRGGGAARSGPGRSSAGPSGAGPSGAGPSGAGQLSLL